MAVETKIVIVDGTVPDKEQLEDLTNLIVRSIRVTVIMNGPEWTVKDTLHSQASLQLQEMLRKHGFNFTVSETPVTKLHR